MAVCWDVQKQLLLWWNLFSQLLNYSSVKSNKYIYIYLFIYFHNMRQQSYFLRFPFLFYLKKRRRIIILNKVIKKNKNGTRTQKDFLLSKQMIFLSFPFMFLSLLDFWFCFFVPQRTGWVLFGQLSESYGEYVNGWE